MELGYWTLLALVTTGLGAGLLGALVGVGGGIIVVPVLVLLFQVDVKIAVATSLIAVVASSTAAGSIYVGKGLAHMRLAMILEVATTLGAITGGLIALSVAPSFVTGVFALLLVLVSITIFRQANVDSPYAFPPEGSEPLPPPRYPSLSGVFFDVQAQRRIEFHVQRLGFGSVISFFAGILSGMLGVGGGIIKVPTMNIAMKIPIKVAAATSNFMIGVTAIASLFVYFSRGFVQPLLAVPVALGVAGGALIGTQLAQKLSSAALKKIFSLVMLIVAAQMLFKTFGALYGN